MAKFVKLITSMVAVGALAAACGSGGASSSSPSSSSSSASATPTKDQAVAALKAAGVPICTEKNTGPTIYGNYDGWTEFTNCASGVDVGGVGLLQFATAAEASNAAKTLPYTHWTVGSLLVDAQQMSPQAIAATQTALHSLGAR